MRAPRNRRALVASVIVLATVLGVGALVRTAGATRTAGRAIAWHACPEDPSAECGTVRVPVDWADPYGPRLDIAVARRRATDPANRIGALVINPGGPGGSGVDFAIGGAALFSAELRRRFDLVGFDPRGVGRSNPVRCSAALTMAPSPVTRTPAGFAALAAHNRRLAADCRRHSGPVFDHVDTASVAHDLDALRAALGERQLNYYGVSYGTLLGQQYAETYPHRVRAVVLDSVMDHSLGVRQFLDTEAAAAQDSFDQFVAWCARDPRCVLRGRDLRALWAGLLRRAGSGGVPDPVEPARRLSAFDLVSVAHSAFYVPEWYALAYYLQAAEEGAAAPAAATVHAGRRAASRAAVVEHPFPAVFCADWQLPVPGPDSYAAHLRRSAVLAPDMRYSPLALAAAAGCLGWPHRPANPQRPARAARTPMLLVNARYDPATAHDWARGVARQLGPRARLLTYDGWGHAVYGRGPCTVAAVDRYLLTLALPAGGARCPAVPPEPFGIGRRGRHPLLPGPAKWVAFRHE